MANVTVKLTADIEPLESALVEAGNLLEVALDLRRAG